MATGQTPFHPGELAVQARAGVREEAVVVGRMVRDEIGPGIVGRIGAAQLVVAATVNAAGELDLSLMTGAPGVASVRDAATLVVEPEHPLDRRLVANLARDPRIGLIGVDLGARGRFRANGHASCEDDRRIVVRGDEFFGNCPKYIQRHATRLVDDDDAPAARSPDVAAVHTFFVATINGASGIDVSHRGGNPGVLRATRAGFEWSDYRGNNLFQTLGNIDADPRVAILIPDLTVGSLLQINGQAEVVWDGPDRRTIAVTTTATTPLPYPGPRRFDLVERSPVNPVDPSGPA